MIQIKMMTMLLLLYVSVKYMKLQHRDDGNVCIRSAQKRSYYSLFW